MVIREALLLALALMCWPLGPDRFRLASLLPVMRPGLDDLTGISRRSTRCSGVLRGIRGHVAATQYLIAVLTAGSLGAWLGGPGGGLAGLLVAGLATRQWRSARQRGRHSGELATLLEAVAVMTAELRTGAHPAAAARVAAESISSASAASARWWPVGGARTGQGATVGRVLGSVAAGARLGAPVPILLARHAEAEPEIGGELTQLSAAWAMADRHGIALAELLETVRADLESRSRMAGQIGSQLAGPRSTAAVLAVLPVLGVLLGQGIGANPWRVLTATMAGQLLLVLGTVLTCAGVLWSGRITTNVVAR